MGLYKAEFQINTQCNMNCVFCFNNGHIENNGLANRIIFRQIRGAIGIGLKQVWITGGEPLLNAQQVFQIIEFCKKRGLSVGLSSNGLLLCKYSIDLKKAGLNKIRVSLDSSDELVFQRLRGGSLLEVIEGIKSAVEAGLSVTLRTTITKENSSDMKNIIGLSGNLCVDAVEIKPVLPVGRADVESMLSNEEFYNAFIAAKNSSKENNVDITCVCNYLPECEGFKVVPNIACQCSHSAIYIASDGEIMPCSYFPYEHRFNAYKDKISDVWESSFFEKVRHLKPQKCEPCISWDSCRNGCPAVLHHKGMLGWDFYKMLGEGKDEA